MVGVSPSFKPKQSNEPDKLNTNCCNKECRKGEESKTYFRSGRFYKIDGHYYFSTREGCEVGPYESKGDAEAGLERFIDSIVKDENVQLAKRLALSGNWAVTMFQ